MVGCRGRGALRRGLLGSVSTGLIHHAHCPVAVIHDKVPSLMQPVLVGIDGSPASELATAIAFDEASWRGVDLVPLHTWSDAEVSDVPSQEWSAQQAAAEEPLAERITGWQDRYPDVSVEGVVVWDQPARRLLDQSESTQLVIVGSHGRGGFTGMLLGSVSTAVVHGARIPVIVARQPSNCVYSDRIHRSDRWRYRNRAAAVRVRSPPSPRYAHRGTQQSSPQHGALSPLPHPRTQLYFVDGEWPTSVPAASTRRSSSPNPLHCRDYRHRSAVLATPRTTLWPCRSSDAYDFADRWPTEP